MTKACHLQVKVIENVVSNGANASFENPYGMVLHY